MTTQIAVRSERTATPNAYMEIAGDEAIQARCSGGWKTVKSVVLTDTEAEDPTGQRSSVWSHAQFELRVARGTLLRAVFPKSQAGACHAAGVSTTRRA